MKSRATLVAAAILSLLSSASHALPGNLAPPPHLPSQAPSPDSEFLPLEDFSPSFLGMYRKVMEIEDEILQHAERYDLDPHLAWAVCLYESGGNANLTSRPGARGYFQVMPATFRSLRVETNIEAGVKYLAQMVARFDRELGGGCKVVATGGLARLIEAEAGVFDEVNEDLTLAGLRIIYELNS